MQTKYKLNANKMAKEKSLDPWGGRMLGEAGRGGAEGHWARPAPGGGTEKGWAGCGKSAHRGGGGARWRLGDGGCGGVAGRRGLGRGVVHFVALAVGGYEGVGEDGLGLGQQFFGLFETGADVGEEELPGLGLEGQGGGLHGGAM